MIKLPGIAVVGMLGPVLEIIPWFMSPIAKICAGVCGVLYRVATPPDVYALKPAVGIVKTKEVGVTLSITPT